MFNRSFQRTKSMCISFEVLSRQRYERNVVTINNTQEEETKRERKKGNYAQHVNGT